MVTLEVGVDVSGVTASGAQAAGALGGIAQAAALVSTSLASSSVAAAGFGAALTAAMPWITAIGAALSAVTTGILLFTDRTKEATSAWDKLGDSMRRSVALRQTAEFLGEDPAGPQQAITSRLRSAIQQTFIGGPVTAGGLGAAITGQPWGQGAYADLVQAYAESVGQGVWAGGRWASPWERLSPEGQAAYTSLMPNLQDLGWHTGAIEVAPGAARELLRYQYGQARHDERQRVLAGRPSMGSKFRDPVSWPRGAMAAEQFQEWRAPIDAENLNRMREIEQLSKEIGTTLGDAAFDFATGLRDGRDILASMLMDLGRGLSREAMTEFSRFIISQFGQPA